MMYMFCGDSHSRQFQMDFSGQFSFTSFSGASLKGLGSDDSRLALRQTVADFACVGRRKTLLLMFGNVDLDATYFKKLVEVGSVDDEAFFAERAEALSSFIELCWARAGKNIAKICILLPQLSPLTDEYFVDPTAIMAKIDPESLRQIADRDLCSHLSRCRRTIAFNDYIANTINLSENTSLFRIDKFMANQEGMIEPRFFRVNKKDHHARNEETLALWHRELKDEVKAFQRIHDRRMQKAMALTTASLPNLA